LLSIIPLLIEITKPLPFQDQANVKNKSSDRLTDITPFGLRASAPGVAVLKLDHPTKYWPISRSLASLLINFFSQPNEAVTCRLFGMVFVLLQRCDGKVLDSQVFWNFLRILLTQDPLDRAFSGELFVDELQNLMKFFCTQRSKFHQKFFQFLLSVLSKKTLNNPLLSLLLRMVISIPCCEDIASESKVKQHQVSSTLKMSVTNLISLFEIISTSFQSQNSNFQSQILRVNGVFQLSEIQSELLTICKHFGDQLKEEEYIPILESNQNNQFLYEIICAFCYAIPVIQQRLESAILGYFKRTINGQKALIRCCSDLLHRSPSPQIIEFLIKQIQNQEIAQYFCVGLNGLETSMSHFLELLRLHEAERCGM
jgi:serine/threonine protein kinase